MRIVVFGAGAVGSVIGGRLAQHTDRHGHGITLVARGEHRRAMAEAGLTLNDPSGSVTLPVDVVGAIDEIPLAAEDVVVLAMKSQDTAGALDTLVRHAPAGVAVACAQNGVENERLALRRFGRVYGLCVMLPATLLEPGIVDAAGAPHNGILDLGRYPQGVDATAAALAAALEASGFASRPDPDVMRAKYGKLLLNLGNALDALVGDEDRGGALHERARVEAEQCFAAAGIAWTGPEEDRARRAGVMRVTPVPGRERGGGSTWQSLVRGAASTEVDWLNGEVVLLGRLYGVPTPVNAMLQAAMHEAVQTHRDPRSWTTAELAAQL